MKQYRQGKKIKSIIQFEQSGKTIFLVRGKPLHIGWIESWQYHYLKNIIKSGVMYEAERIKRG